ncbi:hypothetical protein BH10BAC4_BH10BAC4_25250 [soil metagenome]
MKNGGKPLALLYPFGIYSDYQLRSSGAWAFRQLAEAAQTGHLCRQESWQVGGHKRVGAPAWSARQAVVRGVFFFGYFILGKQKKVTILE